MKLVHRPGVRKRPLVPAAVLIPVQCRRGGLSMRRPRINGITRHG